MTSRAKRLTLVVGVVAVVAVTVGAVLAPRPASAAKKATDPNVFTITTEEPVYMDGSTGLGTFTAQGAIKDGGSALSGTDPDLWLAGRRGVIHIDLEGDTATVGITDYAQGQLGDIVFVELPSVGTMLEKGKDAAVVESVKAASDVYAPISGEVTEANGALEDDPALVNSSPEEDGWFFRMTVSDKSQLEGLMDQAAYKSFCDGL